MSSVIICICTYKRDELIKKLLFNINSQENILDNTIKVFIVDNYEKSSLSNNINKDILDKLEIFYFKEKMKGITFARNRAIKEIKKHKFDYCIFLDDDEFLDKNWLDNMIKCAKKYSANIITGPVISLFDENTEEWIIKSKFFERQRKDTGVKLKTCGAGNVLIKKKVIDSDELYFNTEYAFSGGEDTELFLRLTVNGEEIIYCNEAIAYEMVHKDRLSMRYMIKRKYVNSITLVKIEKSLLNKKKIILKRLILGSVFFIQGILTIPIFIYKGKLGIFNSLNLISKGLGQLCGLVGVTKELY